MKHIAFYDENHKQIRCIDFQHEHNGKKPHAHDNMNHSADGMDVSEIELKIADAIVKGGFANDYK